MAVDLVASSKKNTNSADSHIVDKPVGTTTGDFLLAFHTASVAHGSHSAPAGWTKLRGENSASATGSNPYTSVWYRFAAAGEASTYNFGESDVGAAGDLATVIHSYRGVDPAAPIEDDSGDFATAAGTTATALALTTTRPRCLIVFAVAVGATNEPTALPMTDVALNAGSAAYTQGTAEELNPEADTFGPESATWTTAAGWTAHMVALAPENVAPNAPIGLAPDGKKIDRDVTNRFSWTFSDTNTDEGDTQSKYDLRYRPDDGVSSWTTVSANSTSSFHDFAAGTFTDGDWEWQVRTYDAVGLVGPYSSSAFFEAGENPADPTFIAPIAGSIIPSEDYTFTISHPDLDTWEWRVVGDDGAGNPDATDIIIDATVMGAGVRSATAEGLPNSTKVHLQARVKKDGLYSSDWASTGHDVSFTTPPVPTAIVSEDTPTGAISLQASHPVPEGAEPTVTAQSWHVRVADNPGARPVGQRPVGGAGIQPTALRNVAPSSTAIDWAVASRPPGSANPQFEYRVQAHGDNGTSSYSEWTSATDSVPLLWDGGPVLWDGEPVLWAVTS